MTEAVQLAILGVASGAMLSLAAHGVVLIYRGSGVLNLAHTAMGSLALFVYWDLHDHRGVGFGPALVAGVAAAGLCGLLTHRFVLKPFRQASTLTRLIATLAVLVVVQSLLALHYGPNQRIASAVLPTSDVRFGSYSIGQDRLILLGVAIVVTAALHVVYRRTRFGLATTATAENPRAAAALGFSPDLIAAVNWTVGAGLAGLASVLMAPVTQVQLTTQSTMLASVLVAALLGRMKSFPLTFVGGAIVGVCQAEVSRYVHAPGWGQAVPFLLIIVVLAIRDQGIPMRPQAREVRPRIGSGTGLRKALVGAGLVAGALMILPIPVRYVDALALTFAVGIVLASSVVVTGYAGQLSLCQFSFAGAGAVIAGLLVSKAGFSFLPAMVVAAVVAFPIGLVIGLPALKARGINLAIATLGLAVAAQGVLFVNTNYTGGDFVSVPAPSVAGVAIDAFRYPERYAVVCLALLVAVSIMISNVRRGRSGRRLVAVRSNERAAAALGINVYGAKLFAFALSSSIAAIGGILLVFRQTNLSFSGSFDVGNSINGILYAVIGGIGFVVGPLFGSLGQPAGVIDSVFFGRSHDFGLWLAVVSGAITIRLLQRAPDGLITMMRDHLHAATRRLRKPREASPAAPLGMAPAATQGRVDPKRLTIDKLRVTFGGVVALDGFSADVGPGEILGVIGPNGAGKTTLIEAITGFTKPAAGFVAIDGERVDRWPAHRRTRYGLGRTFQSLELFDDMTVGENLRTAADDRALSAYAADLLVRRETQIPSSALAAIQEFGLGADLDRLPGELPYGRRRLVAIARAIAANPSILLMDEPAAGLAAPERRELATVVRRLADEWGMSILLVEHDVEMVMTICDRVVALDFGRPIAAGPPIDVRSNAAVIAAYLGAEDAADEPDTVAMTSGTTR